MDFKNFDWSFKSIAKIIGILIGGIITLVIVIALVGLAIDTIFNRGYQNNYNTGMMMPESAYYGDSSDSIRSLSQKIVVPPEPGNDYATGETAEAFEIKEYSADIRTNTLDSDCKQITELKKLDYVIFENSNQGKKNCNFSFKAKRENENEIIAIINALNPDSLNANIYTIKKIIDDFDSELDILQKKLASVEKTLADAQSAYDELSLLATKKEDIESLTKIIDSKLNLIEKLTQQRIEIRTEIDRFNKSKAEQLDRLQYVYFNVNIWEDLIIDFEQIKENWKSAIQNFFFNLNQLSQNISIHLVEYTLNLIVGTFYLIISFLVLKTVWFITKKIWKRK